jgi:cystathionine gamma-lyase
VPCSGGVDPAHRAKLGIDGELIRLSVGVEDVEDLLHDVETALRAAVKA